ncbi:FAD-binding oxidoreductase [Flavobacteriaceae bacterium]|nr:FAD-binding oxidoreductase [Flavobacteriaceae bacterium]MDC0382717.1 FAD-binding oxidoreductase [Flavobacteriaceae bacterium]
MFTIKLKNNKSFSCDSDTTIFDAAQKAGVILDYSCLNARCSSCVVKVLSGETKNLKEELVLTEEEKKQNFVLSCNAKPLSNLKLDIEDLGNIKLFDKKIVPAKISSIEKMSSDVLKVIFRLPPKSYFQYNAGQYVNLIKGTINRSYSIGNKKSTSNQLEFFIKKYDNGLMSKYWFEEAKINDLLRVEGPLGSFFLREAKCENIVFLATGTGIAPIKAMLESVIEEHSNFSKKKFWIFAGVRYKQDLLWEPNINNTKIEIKYIPVLSRQVKDWNGEKGYVQDIVLKQNINLKDAQVYACGSNEMIQSAKKVLFKNSLKENSFFSDAFVSTN